MQQKAMIQDNTRCIGCRACMVACKEWNGLQAEELDFFAGEGYQNPRDLDATLCVEHDDGVAQSRACEIPCGVMPEGESEDVAQHNECAIGETCVASAGDGAFYCKPSSFRRVWDVRPSARCRPGWGRCSST